MTPERYERYLDLLTSLRMHNPSQGLRIQEIYLLLDPRDRADGPRQAMINRLKRDGILWRQTGLPIRYIIRKERIEEVQRELKITLIWHQEQEVVRQLNLATSPS